MKLKLLTKDISLLFVLLGVFFFPFNSYQGIPALGEFFRDSCLIFFLIAGFCLLSRRKFSIPHNTSIFQMVTILIFWFFLTGIFNTFDMMHYSFKHLSGIERFLRQFISLILVTSLLLIFYNVFKNHSINELFLKIRKAILYSLIIVVIYGTLEFLIVKFGMNTLKSTLYLFDYFPFTSVNLDYTSNRISSTTFESPALATYLLSISGWMFSYVLTEKTRFIKYLPILFTVLFSFLSGSRAGFFIIIVQMIVLGYFLFKEKKFNKLFIKITLAFIVLGFVAFIFFGRSIVAYTASKIDSFQTDDSVHALSNKSRFGIQYAMFQVFLNNPIKGTGYGLQSFESKNLYPEWATKNNWEFRIKYLNEEHRAFPPGYNLYLRILAETGIIGFLFFILLLTIILIKSYNLIIKKNNQSIIALTIFISLVGFIFNWFKMDSFRIYFFWLCLALLILLQKQTQTNDQSKYNSFNPPL